MSQPETKLWAAVIGQAVKDASYRQDPGHSAEVTRERMAERKAARRWLSRSREDFAAVCDWAGVSSGKLRARLSEMRPELMEEL